jgi:pyruvate/2-oxoacid:ferredoxin oxidoreductase alpha subunit/Pyruvate/2-oxoacid:ferredoxin oxidoreductase delta subunit
MSRANQFTSEASSSEVALHLESRISEACMGMNAPLRNTQNMFSRPLFYGTETTSSLSSILGLSSSGLRTALFRRGEQLYPVFPLLHQAVRQKLSLVVHWCSGWQSRDELGGGLLHAPYFALSDTGLFQFFAGNIQEEVDLTLIARRISELSLVPGLIAVDSLGRLLKTGNLSLLSDSQLREYLGSPEDWIKAPTPAQEMIFGKLRPRIPHWSNPDQPVLLGARSDSNRGGIEAQAHQSYFGAHLPQLMKQAFFEFESLTGRSYAPLMGHEMHGAKEAILVQGGLTQQVLSVIQELRSRKKRKVACLQLLSFRPFPSEELRSALKGFKALTVLEPSIGSLGEDLPLFREVRSSVASLKNLSLFSGSLVYPRLQEGDIEAVIENMTQSRESKTHYVLGAEFSRKSSNYPRREILYQNLRRTYGDLEASVLRVGNYSSSDAKQITTKERSPLSIRKFREKGPNYSRLVDFQDRVSSLYGEGKQAEQIIDPFQAVPVMPPASATLLDPSNSRTRFPQIDFKKCTGCSACVLHCPHGAVRSTVLGFEDLLSSGTQIASEKGQPLGPLVPVLKNLAKMGVAVLRDEPEAMSKVSEVLDAALEKLSSKMKLEGERKEKIESDLNLLKSSFGNYPVSVTRDHFIKPDSIKRGSGEVYSLVVDPSACTGCWNCISHCGESAIVEVENSPETRDEALSQLEVWEKLPDIAGESLQRLHDDPDFDSLAAILLSRNYSMSILGAHTENYESLATVIFRVTSAILESHAQPKLLALIAEVDDLIESLQENLRDRLAKKLPIDQLESLDDALAGEDRQTMGLDSLLSSLDDRSGLLGLKVEVLRRQSTLLKELKHLSWALGEGATGLGRSRYTLVVARSEKLCFSEQFPANLFCIPVLMSRPEEALGSALGTLQGQRRHFLDNMRLLHRARLETSGSYDPILHEKQIAELSYEDLSDLEKAAGPKVIIAAESSWLESEVPGGVAELGAGSFPLKLLLLDPIFKSDLGQELRLAPSTRLGLEASAHGGIFVAQTSLASPQHFYSSFQAALGYEGPAMVQVFCPRQSNTGPSPTPSIDLLELALHSRLFPCFRFNPGAANGLGALIDLDGNPQAKQSFLTTQKSSACAPSGEALESYVTPLHWVALDRRLGHHFSQGSDKHKDSIAWVDYLKLEPVKRVGQRPCIEIENESGETERLIPSADLISSCERVSLDWGVLQEMSGLRNPFEKGVRKKLLAEFESLRVQDSEVAKKGYETQLDAMHESLAENARIRVRDRLVELTNGVK